MNTRAALRYAKAVLGIAKEHAQEAVVNDDMKLIAATIQESEDLQFVLNSPVINASDKVKALTSLFGSRVNNFTLGLIQLLAENKRLDILANVASDYTIIYDFLRANDIAKVITAVPINATLQATVLAKVKEITGRSATLENVVNPEILGGFVLRVGDVEYDASVLSGLKNLEKVFDNRYYQAKI